MPEPVVIRGRLTTLAGARGRGWLAGGLGLVWIVLFLVLPGGLIALLAFAQRGADGVIVWHWSLGNFERLAGSSTGIAQASDYLYIVWRTVLLSAESTVLALILAVPICLAITAAPARWRLPLLGLVAVPFCTNLVVRAYGWLLLLSRQGPLSQGLTAIGVIPEPTAFYPGAFAVQLGLISAALPMAVLPLYPSVERLDWTLIEAARDLYASRWRMIRHAVLPQLWPGLTAAFILTFVPALGTFVISDLLGGAKYLMLGNLIGQQFGQSRDWPFGAALSLLLVLLSFLGVYALRRRRLEELA